MRLSQEQLNRRYKKQKALKKKAERYKSFDDNIKFKNKLKEIEKSI